MDTQYSPILHALQNANNPLKIAITGSVHAGKTTTLMHIYQQCRNLNLDIYGFVERAIFNQNMCTGYEFLDLQTQQTCLVAEKLPAGGYQFHEEAWHWAEQRIQASIHHKILIIDELGRLEAQNQGLMPYLCKSLIMHPRHLIASVRKDVIPQIEGYIGDFYDIIYIDDSNFAHHDT